MDFWASRKTEYLYDGRGSVALEYSYNNSWYTLGGALSPGETVSRRYTPFGEPLAGGASPLSRNGTYYGYNGESYDPATGMLNLRARQYEPAQMRFSQQDLLRGDLSAPTTLNRYLYCVNDPVTYADYNGLAFVNAMMADGGGSARMGGSPQTGRSSPAGIKTAAARRAENRVKFAQAAADELEAALTDVGVDAEKLTGKQRKIVEDAKKKLKEKAANGTLTEDERKEIIGMVCTEVNQKQGVPILLDDAFAEKRDVTLEVTTALESATSNAETKRVLVEVLGKYSTFAYVWGRLNIYDEFKNTVNHNKAWDIKRKERWEETIGIPYPGFDTKVIYKGQEVTPENLGNITYGYLGASYGIPVVALIGGSYYAAGFPTEGDALNNEVGDWHHIYIGYMQYESDSSAEMSNTIVF